MQSFLARRALYFNEGRFYYYTLWKNLSKSKYSSHAVERSMRLLSPQGLWMSDWPNNNECNNAVAVSSLGWRGGGGGSDPGSRRQDRSPLYHKILFTSRRLDTNKWIPKGCIWGFAFKNKLETENLNGFPFFEILIVIFHFVWGHLSRKQAVCLQGRPIGPR